MSPTAVTTIRAMLVRALIGLLVLAMLVLLGVIAASALAMPHDFVTLPAL